MPPKKKYTDPKLRDEVKEEVQQGDKGGAPGQWSARKAQFMASEYKKRGGDYTTDKKDQDESQKNLSKWSEEDWQTKEGSGNAKQEDGTEKRYLPKKAWEGMTEEEKKETDEKKLNESKKGKQHVGNTRKAKSARQKANKQESRKYEAKKENEEAADDPQQDNEEEDNGNQEASKDAEDEDNEDQENSKYDSKPGKKRGRPPTNSSSKKQKTNPSTSPNNNKEPSSNTVGSKKDPGDPPAKQASLDRLPEKGQTVKWKALPGWVEGTVVEIVREEKEVEGGKKVKAKRDDPRIVLKSASSGKIAVHKVGSVYFD